jgi:hypothetical protein
VYGWAPDGPIMTSYNVLAWNVADGLPTDAGQPTFNSMESKDVAVSPDGFWRAEIRGTTVMLFDQRLEHPEKERQEWLGLDVGQRLWWHRQQVNLATKNNDYFPLEFHLRWLLRDDPNDATLKLRYEQTMKKLNAITPMEPLTR